jgi:ribonuclease HI
MTEVVIYTDGACSRNPGPGGWGVVLRWNGTEKELHGGDPQTTNNRMELMAAIQALEALKRPTKVNLHTDSTYLLDGITKWIKGWQRNGWLTAAKKPVKNADLWRRLAEAINGHDITWSWVKGHAGDAGNERADALARLGCDEAGTNARSGKTGLRAEAQPAARDPYGGAKMTTMARSSRISVNWCVSIAGTNTTVPGPTWALPELVTSVARPDCTM